MNPLQRLISRLKTRTAVHAIAARGSRIIEVVISQVWRWRYPKVYFGKALFVRGRLIIKGPGKVRIGKSCVFDNATGRPNKIVTFDSEAMVIIGDNCYLNGIEIASRISVEIGNDCLIADCLMLDTDFHSIEINRSDPNAEVKHAPINIDRNVWVGNRTIILKGVSVGENSVIGAGAVVRKSVPANVVVIGNPQQTVKTLDVTP